MDPSCRKTPSIVLWSVCTYACTCEIPTTHKETKIHIHTNIQTKRKWYDSVFSICSLMKNSGALDRRRDHGGINNRDLLKKVSSIQIHDSSPHLTISLCLYLRTHSFPQFLEPTMICSQTVQKGPLSSGMQPLNGCVVLTPL